MQSHPIQQATRPLHHAQAPTHTQLHQLRPPRPRRPTHHQQNTLHTTLKVKLPARLRTRQQVRQLPIPTPHSRNTSHRHGPSTNQKSPQAPTPNQPHSNRSQHKPTRPTPRNNPHRTQQAPQNRSHLNRATRKRQRRLRKRPRELQATHQSATLQERQHRNIPHQGRKHKRRANTKQIPHQPSTHRLHRRHIQRKHQRTQHRVNPRQQTIRGPQDLLTKNQPDQPKQRTYQHNPLLRPQQLTVTTPHHVKNRGPHQKVQQPLARRNHTTRKLPAQHRRHVLQSPPVPTPSRPHRIQPTQRRAQQLLRLLRLPN